ncbi:hypothetical protein K7X08_013863 [Anisodus acutangulus]|uniref:Uncharacterized protein n=1 Tax=Anisodus acutangulus TaxID=402998 RepID=A0A9Q1LPP1_9SOLA|nr:hypothetical protein K7X08_013863 [Anisodus acutangulus]
MRVSGIRKPFVNPITQLPLLFLKTPPIPYTPGLPPAKTWGNTWNFENRRFTWTRPPSRTSHYSQHKENLS